jgi:hypothetical protein
VTSLLRVPAKQLKLRRSDRSATRSHAQAHRAAPSA